MSNSHKLIKDLLIFFGTENYKKYLEEHNIRKIPVDQLDRIVTDIYKVQLNDLDSFGLNNCSRNMFLLLKY